LSLSYIRKVSTVLCQRSSRTQAASEILYIKMQHTYATILQRNVYILTT